jgi:uncharacterized protein
MSPKLTSRVLAQALAVVLIGAWLAPPAQALEREDLTIATTPAGTLFFSVGGGIARVLQAELAVRASPRPYGSPSRGIPLLNQDDVALALVSSLDAMRAYAGLSPYPRANRDIRLLARVMPMMNGYFVRADGPYRTFDDVRGARMVYELRGSHAQTLCSRRAAFRWPT